MLIFIPGMLKILHLGWNRNPNFWTIDLRSNLVTLDIGRARKIPGWFHRFSHRRFTEIHGLVHTQRFSMYGILNYVHLPYNSTKWRYIDIPYMDGMGYGIWRAFLERKWNLYISFRFTSNLLFIVFRLPCSGTSLSWSAKYETLDCYHSKCCI